MQLVKAYLTREMKLYLDFAMEPARAVYIFMKYNNIDFETHVVCVLKGENRTPEYRKINSLQQVPALDDDGFILTRSIAIMRYIARKYNVADHWFQTQDIQKEARVNMFLNWYLTNLRKSCLDLELAKFSSRVALAGFPKIPYDAEKIKTFQANLAKTVNDLDEHFLKGKPFIVGDEITIADLLAYSELLNQDMIQDETYKCNENVNAWMGRVASKVQDCMAEPMAVLEEWKAVYAAA